MTNNYDVLGYNTQEDYNKKQMIDYLSYIIKEKEKKSSFDYNLHDYQKIVDRLQKLGNSTNKYELISIIAKFLRNVGFKARASYYKGAISISDKGVSKQYKVYVTPGEELVWDMGFVVNKETGKVYMTDGGLMPIKYLMKLTEEDYKKVFGTNLQSYISTTYNNAYNNTKTTIKKKVM